MTRENAAGQFSDLARFPEMNPGPVCRMDSAGLILSANSAAKRLFHDESLVGQSWLDLCPDMNKARWSTIVENSHTVLHEVMIGDVWISFAHVCADGKVFVYGTNVTALKHAERQLAAQDSELAEVARFQDINPGPVVRTDPEGTILFANAAARSLFGEELAGKCWWTLCPAVDQSAWNHILASEQPVPLEARVQDREFVFAHRKDPQGKFVFVFGADVTQEKLAERALRQSDKMATLGTLAAGITHELNNPAAATRRAADQLREALKRLEQSLVQLSATTLSLDESGIIDEWEARAKEAALRPGDLDPVSRLDLEAAVEDWLDERSIQLPGNITPFLVGQGITVESLSDLESSLREDLFPRVVAWVANVFPVYRLLHEISQGSQRISEIVSAMKGYSYVGQAPLRMVNIHEGIDNTLVILRNKLKTGVTVKREYAGDIPCICAYASELNQVWTNLLDNAVDAMSGKGEITIRTHNADGWAIIDITDNGPGISPEHISRIFDPFYTTKAPGKGTGLGLSTTYSIVKDKHKGEIAVDSRPGKTTFTVRLLIDNPELAHDQKDERSKS